MNATLLPIPLLRGSAIILLAVGIFIVAVHAVLVTLAAQRSALRPRVRVMAPLFVGAFLGVWLIDLIMAPIAAVLSHTQVLGLYPLALVPLFVGPPLGILTHVYSLRNLATAANSDVAGSRPVTRRCSATGQDR
jgi:hypothetical protein